MGTNICDHLNMVFNLANFYQCKKLADEIKRFLYKKQRFRVLLEKEEYSFLLTLESFKVVLDLVEESNGESMDSYLLDCLFKWAENYIKTNYPDEPITIKEFIQETGLDRYISENVFETSESVARFCESRLGRDYFSAVEVTNFFRNKHLKHRNSRWFIINKGETFREHFQVLIPLYENQESKMEFFKGKAVFYDGPEDYDPDEILVVCNVEMVRVGTKKLTFKFTRKTWMDSRGIDISYGSSYVNGPVHLSIVIKWTFRYHCRILKMSHEPNDNSFADLYFTKSEPYWIGLKRNRNCSSCSYGNDGDYDNSYNYNFSYDDYDVEDEIKNDDNDVEDGNKNDDVVESKKENDDDDNNDVEDENKNDDVVESEKENHDDDDEDDVVVFVKDKKKDVESEKENNDDDVEDENKNADVVESEKENDDDYDVIVLD